MTLFETLRSLPALAGRALIKASDQHRDVSAMGAFVHTNHVDTHHIEPDFVPTRQQWRMPDGSLKGLHDMDAEDMTELWGREGPRPDGGVASEAALVDIGPAPPTCPACGVPLLIDVSVSTQPGYVTLAEVGQGEDNR